MKSEPSQVGNPANPQRTLFQQLEDWANAFDRPVIGFMHHPVYYDAEYLQKLVADLKMKLVTCAVLSDELSMAEQFALGILMGEAGIETPQKQPETRGEP